MRQGDSFKDATRLAARATPRWPSGRRFWRGGLVETIATLRYRDEAAYEEWLENRDTVMIAAALSRLSDRQLTRIGLSRETLVIDIEDLKGLADRSRRIALETLEIIDDTGIDDTSIDDTGIGDTGTAAPSRHDVTAARPMAAE